ncbi:glycosyltransferase family 2 protein, partial [Campylobacter jejuni]|nr:glycosyltransferase family 2 protein [Campylobacter jejuni]EAK5837732.1 glycosyltransferase family 2 protein [Campylobacter jejuni]EAK6019215.1 glycosyltransferase family 2 protein [Campylobacter jejuni]EAL2413633.1 glycosyltransferase family 2 protein [Campylobacter jejuni]ECO7158524.1 glycosyltransferase family 2 protein [Campylobacter jejuni]
MNQNKTVGIVIPIYNVENYLRECIESVINQTYLNLEIILVNDGSTDKNSLNIAKEYTLKDERITLFHKKNGGLSSARNVGIEYFSGEYKFINKNQIFQKNTLIEFSVNGNNHYEIHSVYKSYKYFDSEKDLINFTNANIDYIIFLDSDDYWRLNCIEECVSRMNGVEVLWFDYDMFFEQTGEKKYYSTLYTFQLLQEKIITPLEWLKHGITYNSFYNKSKTFAFAWQGMIDFKFLKSIKLKFINGIIFEDVAFGIILFASLKYIYIYPEIMLTYRVRDNSIMQSLNKNTLPFYASYLREYFADEMIAKNYHIILSEILILEELTNFVILFKNTEISHLIPIFFFEYFINKGIGIFNFNNDPMKLEQRFLKTLYTLLNFNTCYIQKLLLNDI